MGDVAICAQEMSEPACTAVVITSTTIAAAADPFGAATTTTTAGTSSTSDSADVGLRTGVVMVLSLITATLWN